jgi:hypothetical protein
MPSAVRGKCIPRSSKIVRYYVIAPVYVNHYKLETTLCGEG